MIPRTTPSPERVYAIEQVQLGLDPPGSGRELEPVLVGRLGVAWLERGLCATTRADLVLLLDHEGHRRAVPLQLRTLGGGGQWSHGGPLQLRVTLDGVAPELGGAVQLELVLEGTGGGDVPLDVVATGRLEVGERGGAITPVPLPVQQVCELSLRWSDRCAWRAGDDGVPVFRVEVRLGARSSCGHPFPAGGIHLRRVEYVRTDDPLLARAWAALAVSKLDTTSTDITAGYGLSLVPNGPFQPGAPWIHDAAVTGELRAGDGTPPIDLVPGHQLLCVGVAADERGHVTRGHHVVTIPSIPIEFRM